MELGKPSEQTTVTSPSRFTVRDVPIVTPGICLVCKTGSVDERKFVDAAISIKWFGAVYLCSECIREMAQLLGFVTPEVAKLLMASNEELVGTNEKLKKNLGELSESHRHLARALGDCTCGNYGDSDVRDSVHSDDAESDGDASPTEPESDESSSVEGFGSVYDYGSDTDDS